MVSIVPVTVQISPSSSLTLSRVLDSTDPPLATSTSKPTCVPLPDIAGNGIVISTLTTASLTLICAVLVAVGGREPPWPLVKRASVFLKTSHDVLLGLLAGLEATQLITAISLTAALFYLQSNVNDPHTTLAVCMVALASNSQILASVALATAEHMHWVSRILRDLPKGLYLVFTCMYLGSTGSSAIFHINFSFGMSAIMAIVHILSTVIARGSLPWYQRGNWRLCLSLALLSAASMWNMVIAGRLKYGGRYSPECRMNEGKDNIWTLGQFMAVGMLLVPLVSVFDAFLLKRHQKEMESKKRDNDSASSQGAAGDIELQPRQPSSNTGRERGNAGERRSSPANTTHPSRNPQIGSQNGIDLQPPLTASAHDALDRSQLNIPGQRERTSKME